MTRENLRSVFRGLSHLTANPIGQYLLDEAVIAGQFMQGIGGASTRRFPASARSSAGSRKAAIGQAVEGSPFAFSMWEPT